LSQVKVSLLRGDKKSASVELVRTTIGNEGGGQLPTDFVLAKRGARWQIIDVVVDGESIAKAVSTRIHDALQKEGYQKLVEDLQKQVAQADAKR